MNCSLSVLYSNTVGRVYTVLRVDMLMLQAMLRTNILQPTPLLVLSCQPSGTQDGAPSSPSPCPPVEVANTLRLCELQQPWQVLYTHAQILHNNNVHVHYSIDGICSLYIRESVDSLCRDDADMPMPPYIREACNRPNAAFVSLFRYLTVIYGCFST